MAIRKIIHIDEDKCDGCELCIPACPEGALRIIDGKAKLVSETYCDGLGACLGECPQDAISIIEREAAEFDEEAVKERMKAQEKPKPQPLNPAPQSPPACPGSMAHSFDRKQQPKSKNSNMVPAQSRLSNWPVQLHLAPIQAQYFDNADLLIAADCVPFAMADFHDNMLEGKTLLIGCPKLDDTSIYRDKLTQIFELNEIKSVTIGFMEVPCCFGLVQLIKNAVDNAGKDIPVKATRIGIKGNIIQSGTVMKKKEVSR